MTYQKSVVVWLLVFLALSGLDAWSTDSLASRHRVLLQDEPESAELTPEEREAEREAAALAAFAVEQERKANESALIIARALTTAEETVNLYLSSPFLRRIEIFTDLLRNADGVALKFALNTLTEENPRQAELAKRATHRAFGKAIREGFASNAAEALSYAFTVKQNENDHVNVLDALVIRKNNIDARREGRGCSFIKNLFSDADLIAHERGDSMAFVASFDSEEYLSVMECFLDACSDDAARCCQNKRALRKGTCGCPRAQPNRCDFNIFANRPRTIWVCSKPGCAPNQKCLCPSTD